MLILGSSVGDLTNKLSINYPTSTILAVEKNTTYQKIHYKKMKENQIENQILATRSINSDFIDELSNEKDVFFRFTLLLDLFDLMHELLPHEFELYLGKLILKSQTTFIFIPDDQQDGISDFINYFQYWKSFTQLIMNACAKVNLSNAIINSFAYHRVFRVDLPVLPPFHSNQLSYNHFPVCFYRNSTDCFIQSNFQLNYNISNMLNYKKIKDSFNKLNIIKESAPLSFIPARGSPIPLVDDPTAFENTTQRYFYDFMHEKLQTLPQEFSAGGKKPSQIAHYCSAIPFKFLKKFSIYSEQRMDLLMRLSYSNLFPADLMEFEEFNFFNFISRDAFEEFLQFKLRNFQFNSFLFDYFQLIQWDSSHLKYFNLTASLPPVPVAGEAVEQPLPGEAASLVEEGASLEEDAAAVAAPVKSEEAKQKELIQWIRNLPNDEEKLEFLKGLLNVTDLIVPMPLNDPGSVPLEVDEEKQRLLKEEKEEAQRKQEAIGRHLLLTSWDYLGNNPVARPVASAFSTGPPLPPSSVNLNKISSVNAFLPSNAPFSSSPPASYSIKDQVDELNMIFSKDQLVDFYSSRHSLSILHFDTLWSFIHPLVRSLSLSFSSPFPHFFYPSPALSPFLSLPLPSPLLLSSFLLPFPCLSPFSPFPFFLVC